MEGMGRSLSASQVSLQQQHLKDKDGTTGEGHKLLEYRLHQNKFLGARFVFECGIKLEATPITIATAATLFHRFFKEVDMKNYDVYLIGATCLYLAGKVENQHLRIRDIINVAHASVHRNSPPLDLGEAYFAYRDAVYQAELLMMRILNFRITCDHPHKFLTHYLKSIAEWDDYKCPIARTSWAILQDFHHDPAVIEYPPEALAVAAIQVAMQIYGAKVALCSDEGRNSWQMIVYPDIQPDIQTEIMMKMLQIYDADSESLSTAAYKETVNGK